MSLLALLLVPFIFDGLINCYLIMENLYFLIALDTMGFIITFSEFYFENLYHLTPKDDDK